jgi:hypothetical protein
MDLHIAAGAIAALTVALVVYTKAVIIPVLNKYA